MTSIASALLAHCRPPLLAAALGAAALPLHAQTWTVTGLTSSGCGDGDTEFAINMTGVSTGTWYFDTIATAGGQTYMDEYFGWSFPDGAGSWLLWDSNDRGQQTASFPIPQDTPITVTMTLRDSTAVPMYRTVVELSQCNNGVITSNVSTDLRPRATTAPVAVPALGEWGLLALGLAAAGMGARRLRRRA